MTANTAFKKRIRKVESREFIFALYSLKSNSNARMKRKKLMEGASAQQIDLIIEIIHGLLIGKIPIRGSQLPRIKASGKMGHIAQHFKETGYVELRSSDLAHKKEVLQNITVYHELLFNFINKK